MPTYRIAAKRLTPGEFANDWRLTRVCRQELVERAFRVDLPVTIERNGDGDDAMAVITQAEPTERLPNNHPTLWAPLQAIAHGEPTAIARLLAVLLAEGDDRVEMVQGIEVGMPEETTFYADTLTEGNDGQATAIDASKLAERELCRRVLLLFGVG